MTSEHPRAKSERARRRLVWATPAVVAGAVAAGVVIGTASPSTASPTLPKRTAAQLLTAVQTKAAQTFSGVVRETANLGLPSLPSDMSPATLSWQTFITGSHSAKVWVDGRDKQRLALLGELSEADVVHNGRDVWTYTSDSNSVSHATLPAHPADHATDPAGAYDPAAVTKDLLERISPSTAVSVDASRYVAGRPAYTLVVRPKDANSTIRKFTVAIDATKYLPLRLQVFGAGSAPAFELGFTKISYAKPAASTFHFTAPAGSTTSTDPLGVRDGGRDHGDHHARRLPDRRVAPIGSTGTTGATSHATETKVLGSGWTSVVELSQASVSSGGGFGGLLNNATTPVGSTGARLLHTALLNAVFLPDGRAFVGAVKPAYLEHVAATNR